MFLASRALLLWEDYNIRRMQSGFENNNLASQCNAVYTGSDWTPSVSTLAARTGSGTYGLRVAFVAASGADHKAYCEWRFGATTIYRNVLSGVLSAFPLVQAGTGTAVSAGNIRFYYRTNMSNSFNNLKTILTLGESTTTRLSIIALRATSPNRISLRLQGSTTGTGTFDVGSSVYYRLELAVWCDGNGAGAATLTIYDENTETVRETITCAIAITSVLDTLRLGVQSVIFNTNAQNHDFDDLAVNDNQMPAPSANIHGGRVGAAACLAAHRPTSDVAQAWVSTDLVAPILNYTEPGSDTLGTADDATYVNTVTGAGTPVDRYGHTAYAGADTVKSVAILVRHRDFTHVGVNDLYHAAGLYDGANYLQNDMTAVGDVYTYEWFIVSEISGGGALSNAWYSGCDIMIRKHTNLAGVNDKRVSYIAVEVEDDDALPITLMARATSQNINQSVERSTIW